MKYFIVFIVLFICVKISYPQGLSTPLLISGKVKNSTGSAIDEANLHLKVYLEESPQFYLTEKSPSCGYISPNWFAELGNLGTAWEYGNVLVIILEDLELKERIQYNWTIDSTASVPDLQTQDIPVKQQISQFKLSERGVVNGKPLIFSFTTLFSQVQDIELKLYSPDGEEIYTSGFPNQESANEYRFVWDGRSNTGKSLRSGIYYYFLTSDKKIVHSGMVSLKND